MLKRFLTTISLALVLMPVNPAKSEIFTKYDEFKGLTIVGTTFSRWTEDQPRLWLKMAFEGRKSTSVPVHIKFRVINEGGYCKGVTGVLADGKRVKTAGEFDRKADIPFKYEDLGKIHYNLRGFGSMWELYRPQEFLQIAQAEEVRYQTCGKAYTLTAEEMQELKEFTAHILTPEVLNKMN